jgi:glycine/serine hydroxymethyltransferase
MGEQEMVEIAELMKRVVVDGENPKSVKEDSANIRSGFEHVHYCFENATKAYQYVKIR